MSTSALLLDLDHTLYDPESIPVSVMEPSFALIREAHARIGGIGRDVLEASIAELMGSPITLVARKYAWPEELRRAALEASAKAVLPERLPLYADAEAVLRLGQRKILVTTGVPAVQLQKVSALGLAKRLDAVHVDDALAVPRVGKKAVFAAILEEERLSAAEVMVVGDNLESEIAAGVALGMRTVHVARWGCAPGCPATHCMPDLWRLGEVL